MKKMRFLEFVLAISMLGVSLYSHAGSDRLIMAMTAKQMEMANLVFVGFTGPDGGALESGNLQRMVIREQDCSSGRILEIVNDYKIGYAPKSFMVGIYLLPNAWVNKTLCFNVPSLGKVEHNFNPLPENGRDYHLKIIP